MTAIGPTADRHLSIGEKSKADIGSGSLFSRRANVAIRERNELMNFAIQK
jgi:hypothetical protein